MTFENCSVKNTELIGNCIYFCDLSSPEINRVLFIYWTEGHILKENLTVMCHLQ